MSKKLKKNSEPYQFFYKLSGTSKIVFKIFNPSESIYYGSYKGFDWEFFTKNQARRWAKSEKLQNFEIHKLETLTLCKEIEIV